MHTFLQVKFIILAVIVSAIFMVHTPVAHADSWSEQQTREIRQQQQEAEQRQERQMQEMQQQQQEAERQQQR